MKRVYKSIDKAIELIESSLPYLPSNIHTNVAVPLLKELRGIAFEHHVETYKSKKLSRIDDDLDTVPQDLLK